MSCYAKIGLCNTYIETKILAEQGEPDSQYTLAKMYFTGNKIDRNIRLAVKWCEKASEQGHVGAKKLLPTFKKIHTHTEDYFIVGHMRYYGNGVDKDYGLAAKHFEKAAKQGNMYAQQYLGMMYNDGKGVKKDYELAVKLSKKAAEQGNPYGAGYLGLLYFNGHDGVGKDYELSAKWFKKAALLGDGASQNFLGIMYYGGLGVKKDNKLAAKWFDKAATQGNANAQNYLALMYLLGEGVNKNLELAEKLFEKASVQGNLEAKRNLIEVQKIKENIKRYNRKYVIYDDYDQKTKTKKISTGAKIAVGVAVLAGVLIIGDQLLGDSSDDYEEEDSDIVEANCKVCGKRFSYEKTLLSTFHSGCCSQYCRYQFEAARNLSNMR